MTDPPWAGRFDMLAALCELMSVDLSAPPGIGGPVADDLVRLSAGMMAADRQQLFLIRNMPDEMVGPLFGQLFHERVHYWQLLTYPVFQYQFLLMLERIRRTIQEAPGYPEGVMGLTVGRTAHPDCEILLNRVQRQIDASTALETEVQRRDLDPIGPFRQGLSLTVPEPGLVVPFRTIGLGLDGPTFALDGTRIAESFTTVLEALRTGSAAPGDATSAVEMTYAGAWLAWRSGQAPDADERLLMRAFLILADLALLGDYGSLIDGRASRDEGYLMEQSMLSVRFGRLVDLELPRELLAEVEEPHGAEKLQYVVGRTLGWVPPGVVAMRQLLRLQGVLVQQLVNRRGPGAVEHFAADLLGRRLEELDDPALARASGNATAVLRSELPGLGVIGVRIAATMADAAYVRSGFPGMLAECDQRRVAMPMVDAFPLPMARLGGAYYHDVHAFDSPFEALDKPIDLAPPALVEDAIRLAVLRPLIKGDTRSCGLVDPVLDEANCMYTSAGLGCPQEVLRGSPQYRQQPDELGVLDFCHRTAMAVNMAFDRGGNYDHWVRTWNLPRDPLDGI